MRNLINHQSEYETNEVLLLKGIMDDGALTQQESQQKLPDSKDSILIWTGFNFYWWPYGHWL